MTKLTKEERLEGFRKEFSELREKYQLDFGASVQPVMQIVDIEPQEEKKTLEDVIK